MHDQRTRREIGFSRATSSVCSLPPCGGGLGRGGVAVARGVSANFHPHPQPSPQGGGERTESVALPHDNLAKTYSAPVTHNTGLAAALGHARYILGENAVTGF